MFKDVVIISAARTAVGSFGGSLAGFKTTELAEKAVRAAIERAGIPAAMVDEVVLGCVGQHGVNGFLARIAALNAGCSHESTAQTVNRLCASGLQAIVTAATAIDHGDIEVAVAGGAESMSNFPYNSYNMRFGARMGDVPFEDALTAALSEPFKGGHIAQTAENIAEKYGISREELDEYALMSQQRAAAAIAEGKFEDEIIPIEVKRKKETFVFDTDEHPRQTSLEKLAALKPLFKKGGVVTAGNASGVNDAAAAVAIMSGSKAAELGLPQLVRIVDYAMAGVDPDYMGLGPVPATRKLLSKAGIKASEVGVWEINEAFAAQALACIRELGLPLERVNLNGSGISLGHPIGATGAVISVKLINEMKRRNEKYGVATLCIGGGQGLSVLYENSGG